MNCSLPPRKGRILQIDLHPFGRRAHFGIVVAGFFHDLVDHGVGVLGIVVEQYKLFRAALHHYIDGFAPMAVSPAPSARFVFLGKILCVIDEDVGAFGQLAHSLVEGSLSVA